MMIHIWNIAKFLVMFIFQLVITIIGWFVVPIGMLWMEEFRPTNAGSKDMPFQKRFKWKWFDAIFGNIEDGLADIGYINKYPAPYKATWWRTYNWYAHRNPIHNLALAMGVNETIVTYNWVGRVDTEDTIGREGFVYSRAIGVSGKNYDMYRWCKLWSKTHGIEMNIGFKNFNVNVNHLPKKYVYSFTVSVNPFKKFEPAR